MDRAPLVHYVSGAAYLVQDVLPAVVRRRVVIPFAVLRRAVELDGVLAEPANAAARLRALVAGQDADLRAVLDAYGIDETIGELDRAGRLVAVVEHFAKADLGPDRVDDATMRAVLLDLTLAFHCQPGAERRRHFTPHDIARFMVNLLLEGDFNRIRGDRAVRTVYDPCSGAGSLLSLVRDRVLGHPSWIGAMNPHADIRLVGDEVDPETWALARSNPFLRSDDIVCADALADRHAGRTFDYLVCHPPFGAPQLPFIRHLLAHAKPSAAGGSRIALVTDGAALARGETGSEENALRRHVIENDLLESLVALPRSVFFDTAADTYVWILSTRKPPEIRGCVELFDARSFDRAFRPALGTKSREIAVWEAIHAFGSDDATRVVASTELGFRTVAVERPPDPPRFVRVPLGEDVERFVAHNVAPHFPGAAVGTGLRDAKDGQPGAVGYRIVFDRHFAT